MTMAIVMTEQSAQNMEYVRRLLKQKQPRFAAALELTVHLVEGEARSAGVHEGSVRNCLYGGFTRDFATADRERVMVAALTQRQFADLARTTRRARTFAFLERLLDADFSACGDRYTHRAAIAVLLAPWFARRTVADVAAAFEGTSVPWTWLRSLASRPGSGSE